MLIFLSLCQILIDKLWQGKSIHDFVNIIQFILVELSFRLKTLLQKLLACLKVIKKFTIISKFKQKHFLYFRRKKVLLNKNVTFLPVSCTFHANSFFYFERTYLLHFINNRNFWKLEKRNLCQMGTIFCSIGV